MVLRFFGTDSADPIIPPGSVTASASDIVAAVGADAATTIAGTATNQLVTPAGLTAKLPHPTPANAGAHFDPRLSVYNLNPSNMLRLRKAVAAAGGFGRIVIGGHSIPAAVPPLVPFQDSWVYQLALTLEARGHTISGEGPVMPNINGAFGITDSRWIVDAAWQALNPQIPYLLSAAGGATATFQSTRAGTIVELLYVDAGASFTVNIDGLGASPIGPTGSGNTILLPIGPLADTVHSIEVVSSAAFAFLPAIGVRDATGLSIVNVSFGGATTAMWQPGIIGGPSAAVTALAPACTFLQFEANDVTLGTAIPTFITQATNEVTEHLAHGDVVLVVDPPSNPAVFPAKPAYDAALYAVVDALGIWLWDLQHHFFDWSYYTASPSLAIDDAHAAAAAHRDIATLAAAIL